LEAEVLLLGSLLIGDAEAKLLHLMGMPDFVAFFAEVVVGTLGQVLAVVAVVHSTDDRLAVVTVIRELVDGVSIV